MSGQWLTVSHDDFVAMKWASGTKAGRARFQVKT